mmetsp:Transcript_63745/g.113414  ORF Transcript_63745/g.113414 Transcript_63745/m.113414 type:complete len:443 (-) Transcript_63745:60-1388(-)
MGASWCKEAKELPPSANYDVLIVGGGNAAGYVCQELARKASGFSGRIGIISDEPVPPYERPALTKAFLHPPDAKVRARLPGFHTCAGTQGERQTSEWYEKNAITFENGRAAKIDLAAKVVQLEKGARFSYEKCIIATGSSPLRVSKFGVTGDDAPGVHYLRSVADATALVADMEKLSSQAKVVVMGGGFLGAEAAAGLVGWKVPVTLTFPDKHVLVRLFNAELGAWMEGEYVRRGIELYKGEAVKEILSKDGRVCAVKFPSGKTIECNVLVIGVGAQVATSWCDESGLSMTKGGINVDGNMQTSDPNVYAIGDVANFSWRSGKVDRCEHIQHARNSATHVAKVISGQSPGSYDYLPYYYSRQFEYSEEPIVFNFFGLQQGTCHAFSRGKGFGAVWESEGKVSAALILGSPGPSPDEAGKLKALAEQKPSFSTAEKVFADAGL